MKIGRRKISIFWNSTIDLLRYIFKKLFNNSPLPRPQKSTALLYDSNLFLNLRSIVQYLLENPHIFYVQSAEIIF